VISLVDVTWKFRIFSDAEGCPSNSQDYSIHTVMNGDVLTVINTDDCGNGGQGLEGHGKTLK